MRRRVSLLSGTAGAVAIVMVAGVWAGRGVERPTVSLTAQRFVEAVASADPDAVEAAAPLVVPESPADDFRDVAVATLRTLSESGMEVVSATLVEPASGAVRACVDGTACSVFDDFELAPDGRVHSFHVNGIPVESLTDATTVEPDPESTSTTAPPSTTAPGQGTTVTTPPDADEPSDGAPPSTEPSAPVSQLPNTSAPTTAPAPATTAPAPTTAPPSTAPAPTTAPPSTAPPSTATTTPSTSAPTTSPPPSTIAPGGPGEVTTTTPVPPSTTTSVTQAPTTTSSAPAPTTTTTTATTSTTLPAPTTTSGFALRPFAANSPWNTRVGSAARLLGSSDGRTATLTAASAPSTSRDGSVSVVTWINASAYSVPVYVASDSDPLVTLSDPSHGVEMQARVPSGAVPAAGTDSNMAIVQPDGRTIDVWTAHWSSPTSIECGRLEITTLAGSGFGPQAGIRASGVSSLGGLVRRWEVDPTDPHYTDGVIRHALAISIPSGMLRYDGGSPGYDAAGFGTARGYVWPATEQDWDSPWTYGGVVPMGTLVAIPRSVDLDSLGLGPEAEEIARALQDYGGYVVDRAGDGTVAFYAEPSVPDWWHLAVTGPAWTGRDLTIIRKLLAVVDDNGPTSIGGAGTH